MDTKLILVIDDDRAVRDAFDLALSEDYEVQLAESGEKGLDLARNRKPDLVFLDLNMPGMDGVETLCRLNDLDIKIKVYIVTAFAQDYMQGLRAAKDRGTKFQLAAKPLDAKQIRAIAGIMTQDA
ncbi:hypothetical protein TI04_09125 [Achromatium sp. WMS2]|nr:hypothetical protein TI04_09125 [Achromatium sp. WMS2]